MTNIKNKTRKHVAVLMGGWSVEREISLSTGAGIVQALNEKGYLVQEIDLQRDPSHLLSLLNPRPDVFFVALHGKGVEDGTLQGFLNMIGIPYTHSGVLASSIAMNKVMAKYIFQSMGIATPDGIVASVDDVQKQHFFEPPYIIKPITEGSSVGVHLVQKGEVPFQLEKWGFGDQVLIEPFIEGREIQVAVIGSGRKEGPYQDRALGAIEICPKTNTGFFDFTAKYTSGFARHLMPAPLPKDVYEEALSLALKAHQTLECRGVTRSDFMYQETGPDSGKFWLLEINTIPGMTPLSLVPEIAAHQGISYPDLVEYLVETAQCDAL